MSKTSQAPQVDDPGILDDENGLQFLTEGVSCCGGIKLTVDWTYLLVEIFARIALLVAAVLVWALVDPFVREVWPTEWYLYAMPYTSEERFPMWLVAVLLVCVPLAALVVLLWVLHAKCRWKRTIIFEEVVFFVLGYSLVLIVGFLASEVIKRLYGRLRPDFLNRCFNTIPADLSVIPVVPECHSVLSASKMADGRMSFPSEHSVLTWAAFLFVALWVYGKLCLFHNTASFRLICPFCICLIPIAISISRTMDYRHFYSDVIGGMILGIFFGWITYAFYWPLNMKPLMADVYAVFESSASGKLARLRNVTAAKLRVRDSRALESSQYEVRRQYYFQGNVHPTSRMAAGHGSVAGQGVVAAAGPVSDSSIPIYTDKNTNYD